MGAEQGSHEEIAMESTLVTIAIILVFIVAIFIPFRLPARKTEKRKRKFGGSLGNAMGAINEIYYPSAHQAGQIVEEMKVARKAIPGAPDPLDKSH